MNVQWRRLLGSLSVVCLIICGHACSGRSVDVGTAANPIRMYFMPLKEKTVFQTHAPRIAEFIRQRTGLVVEPIAAPDNITIVQAFNVRTADIAFMNTLGYLMARDWTKVQAHLRVVYGEGETEYRGAIVARADSGIRSVTDLNGKTVALADPFSASGYLYSLRLFEAQGVKPGKVLLAKGHLDGLEKVYRGEVDAATTFYERPTRAGEPRDARIELRAKHPDILTRLTVVALTDPIPNGPVALRADLPPTIQTHLVGSLIEFTRTAEGAEVLKALYNVTGLTLARDCDYDGVRQALKGLGKSSEELVAGGLQFYKTQIGVGLIQ